MKHPTPLNRLNQAIAPFKGSLKIGLSLAAATVLFSASAHAQIYVGTYTKNFDVQEYSTSGTLLETSGLNGENGDLNVDGSYLYATAGNDTVDVLNAKTLALTRSFTLPSAAASNTVPILAEGGDVYYGNASSPNKIYAATTSGTAVAGFTPISIHGSGVAYELAYTDGDLFVPGYGSNTEGVGEFNATTGALISSFNIGGGYDAVTSLAFDAIDNDLYIGMEGGGGLGGPGELFSYNLTSDTLTKLEATSGSITNLATSGSTLYVAEFDYAQSTSSPSQLVSYAINSNGSLSSTSKVLLADNYISGIAVPEPSDTAYLIVGSAVVLLFVLRRKLAGAKI